MVIDSSEPATVKITYERDGKERTVDVTLGQRKGDS